MSLLMRKMERNPQTIWTPSEAKWRLGAPSSFTPKQGMKR